MRKFTSLTKSLLVAAALLVGGASHAWATDVPYTVGTEGTGDAWANRQYSDAYEIAPGEIYHFTFTNASYGSDNWNNWLLDCKATADTSVGDQYFTMRSDNYGWGTGYNSAMRNNDFVWGDFQTVMNGATVNMYVDYNGTDKIIRTYTTITKDEIEWHYNFASKAIDAESVFLFLSEELAVLNITTAEKVTSLPDGTYTLYKRTTTETDCGEQWKADDKDNIWVPSATNDNFTYAIDGGLSLANTSPNANFKSSYSASRVLTPNENTTVRMTAVATMGVASGRAASYDYITIGGVSLQVNGQNQKAQVYVDNVAQGIEVNATRGASYTFNVEINQATGDVTYSVSGGATIAEAAASTSTAISNVVLGHFRGGSESYNTNIKLTNIDITEQISAVSYANYTVHFQDNNGAKVKEDEVRNGEVGATVNANSADMATFYSGDYKYVYSGDGGGVEVKSDGSSEMTVTYTKYGKYTYNVYAVNDSEAKLSEDPIATATTYDDEEATLTWSKYIKIDDTWYSTLENTFRITATEAGSRNVVYSATDITYFYEMENLTRNGGQYLKEESTSYSNYLRIRLSKGSLYYTPALTGGTYLISIPWENGNNNANEVYVYTRSSDGDLSEKLATFIAPKGSGTFTATITVPDGYSIAFNGNEGGSYNNNARMDYMTLKSVSTVSVTVSDASYATYVPTCDLNFSASEIEAYKVKVNEKGKATLTKVDNVPAGTPVLLYKDGGATENIPVMTGAAAVTDNDLVAGTGATVATTDGDYTNMILNNVGGNIGFYFAAGQTVAANRAYLHFATSLAPEASSRMVMVFGEETTGISDTTRLNNKEEITNIYNLSGQRVAQPTKGLYIVNGKKVIIK